MAKMSLAFDILANDAKASKTLDHFANKADHTGKRVSGTFRGLGKTLVGAVAGFATISVFKGFIDQAEESRKVARLTAQVIKSTGGAAHLTAKQVNELATTVSNKTGIDDEAIQSGENLLLTFTNVRNEVGKGNKIFDRATGILADMSVALGQDTKSSAIQLGKALNDPIKGVTALQRVGVSFTKQQRDQIATLVKSGKTLDAQKVILRELGKEFGGAAEAAATPSAKLRVAVGNLSEDIGGLLLPAVDKAATFMNTKGVPAIEGFIKGFQDGTGPGGKFADAVHEIGHEAEGAWRTAKPFFGFVADHPKLFTQIGKDALIFAAAMKGIGAVKKLPGLGSLLGGSKGGIFGSVGKGAPLPVFVTNPGFGGGLGGSGGGVPTVLGKGGGTIAEGRFGKILASNLTAQAVVLADVVLGEKAANGLKNTIFPLKFNLSVNDAAKEFLAKLQSASVDDATRKIMQRHADMVFEGVAEAAKTGSTKLLQQALLDVDADLQAHRKDILKAQAIDAKKLETLLTGGLNRTKAFARASSRDISTSLSTGIGTGVRYAMARADGLDVKLAKLGAKTVKPKVDLAGASTAYAWANRITGNLHTLDGVKAHPSVAVVDRASVRIANLRRQLAWLDGRTVNTTVGVRIRTLNDLPLPTGATPKHSARGNFLRAGEASWVGESGKELFIPGEPGTVVPHGKSMAMAGRQGSYYELHLHGEATLDRQITRDVPRVMAEITYLYGRR